MGVGVIEGQFDEPASLNAELTRDCSDSPTNLIGQGDVRIAGPLRNKGGTQAIQSPEFVGHDTFKAIFERLEYVEFPIGWEN